MDRDAAFEVQLARVLDEIGRLQNKLGAGELAVPGSKGQPPGWSSASAATAATPPDITERFRPARHGELATVKYATSPVPEPLPCPGRQLTWPGCRSARADAACVLSIACARIQTSRPTWAGVTAGAGRRASRQWVRQLASR